MKLKCSEKKMLGNINILIDKSLKSVILHFCRFFFYQL